jgi:hypothetical protein
MLSPTRYFVTHLPFIQACYCVASKSAFNWATIYGKPDDMPDAETLMRRIPGRKA